MIRAALAVLLVLGCGGRLPVHTVEVAGHALTVEVAATPEHRSQGLMGREHLPDDHGMLFVYPDEAERTFWMKDTPLPLSIAFADRAGVILHLADLEPFSTESVPSVHPAAYALEVNQGWFDERGIEAGARIERLPEVQAR